MEYLFALALSALAGWLLSSVGVRSLESAVGAFRALIGGWQADGWPRGVQEEDRDRPWGEPTPASQGNAILAVIDTTQAVATSRLHGRTRAR